MQRSNWEMETLANFSIFKELQQQCLNHFPTEKCQLKSQILACVIDYKEFVLFSDLELGIRNPFNLEVDR